VVVASLAEPADEELVAALGVDGHEALCARLLERATAWCGEAAQPTTLTAASAEDLPALLGDHDGPVFLVGADVPALGPQHLQAARSDLEDGVLATLAPATDGRPFLVALAEPDAGLLAAACDGFAALGPLVRDRGGAVGLLRSERRLQTLGDARALLADPTAPPDLVALLRAARLEGEPRR
jgi:hypothetical protein